MRKELCEGTLFDELRGLALQALRLIMIQKGWSRRYVNRQVVRFSVTEAFYAAADMTKVKAIMWKIG